MPTSVLYVSHTPEFKGSAVSLYQLMTGLDRARFRPVAAFSKPGPMVEKLTSIGVPAYVLARRGLLCIGLVREAMRLIKAEGIGLVHLNSAVPFSKYAGIAAKLSGVPVVWHVREDPEGSRVRKNGPWVRLLSDRIFAVSTDIEVYFSSSGKALKIYNGVDTDVFRPGLDGGSFRDRYGIPVNAFVFGMVGTIEPRKGVLSFLEAAETLLAARPSAWFLIVGSGQRENEDELLKYLEARPALKARTTLAGRVTDVPLAMAALDVLVMPSLWEGFPRALIEAMACGRPSIATQVGEVGNILEDGRTGFVIPKAEVSAISGAMLRCMEMGDDLLEMGRLAREAAVERFGIKRHIDLVMDEYDKITAR
ncbi:MAG: glycosyltransferase [Nitrospirae bacterium]|nr:glycosyltransferase [Nitrospirota bacterium]